MGSWAVDELLRVADDLRDSAEDVSARSAQLVTLAEKLGRDVGAMWAFPVGTDEYPPAAWYVATVHDEGGRRNNGYGHTGIDLNVDRWPWGDVDRGQPVFAVADGVVRAVDYSSRYLGSVVIEVEHDGGLLYWRYWHLANDEAFRALAEWQAVRAGDCLGLLGNYTLGAGGDHLHLDCALDNFGAHWWFTRHPDVRFAVDTMMPNTVLDVIPRNAQVWNFHSYDLWPVYGVFEQGLMRAEVDLNDPAAYAPVRRFLRPDVVPFETVVDSRAGRPTLKEDWYRRIWLYRNLDPNAMPELERLLQEHLEENVDRFKQRATEAVKQAFKVRDELLPGIPLVLGEGASYCADHRFRWEERSDVYWDVVEHAARTWREHEFWGAVACTYSGPTDPVWHEYPKRLQRANAVFLGKKS